MHIQFIRKKILIRIMIVGIICCLFYYCIINNIITKYNDYTIVISENNKTQAFFVNETGCQMPALDVMNEKIKKFFFQTPPVRCAFQTILHAYTESDKNYLKLHMTKENLWINHQISNLSKIKCSYTAVQRDTDMENKKLQQVNFTLLEARPLEVEKGVDLLHVKCSDQKNKILENDVHFFIKPLRIQQQKSVTKTKRRMSVIIIGIDSMSHMNLLRQMKKTVAYLRKNLSHVEFWGYNKIARNTYPNLIPLLSGKNVTEFENFCLNKYGNFDQCNTVWKHYKAAGYNTSFGEDSEFMSLFNYFKPGFKQPPTDYYLRPVLIEIKSFSRYRSNYDQVYCSGNRLHADVLWSFLYQLVPYMKINPFFSFYWWAEGVHETLNFGQHLDNKFYKMFEHLYETGLLNNTFIFFLSDHGLRWGNFRDTPQGMIEDSMPFFYAIYPSWLKKLYSNAIRNLFGNAKSLITTYDMHATLMDLINLDNLQDSLVKQRITELQRIDVRAMPRGISLFLPIPAQRNCELAAIPQHFCLCYNFKEISINDQHVERVASLTVRNINDLLKSYPQCARLHLNGILKAYMANRHPDEADVASTANVFDIKVRIQTLPGLGQFESTMNFNGYLITSGGTITRTNSYANQTYCVRDYHIEMYCYCVNNTYHL